MLGNLSFSLCQNNLNELYAWEKGFFLEKEFFFPGKRRDLPGKGASPIGIPVALRGISPSLGLRIIIPTLHGSSELPEIPRSCARAALIPLQPSRMDQDGAFPFPVP